MSGERRCIITFSSVHHALKAEKILLQGGTKVTLIPVPREISSDCGIALEVPDGEETRIKGMLEENRVAVEGFHFLRR